MEQGPDPFPLFNHVVCHRHHPSQRSQIPCSTMTPSSQQHFKLHQDGLWHHVESDQGGIPAQMAGILARLTDDWRRIDQVSPVDSSQEATYRARFARYIRDFLVTHDLDQAVTTTSTTNTTSTRLITTHSQTSQTTSSLQHTITPVAEEHSNRLTTAIQHITEKTTGRPHDRIGKRPKTRDLRARSLSDRGLGRLRRWHPDETSHILPMINRTVSALTQDTSVAMPYHHAQVATNTFYTEFCSLNALQHTADLLRSLSADPEYGLLERHLSHQGLAAVSSVAQEFAVFRRLEDIHTNGTVRRFRLNVAQLNMAEAYDAMLQEIRYEGESQPLLRHRDDLRHQLTEYTGLVTSRGISWATILRHAIVKNLQADPARLKSALDSSQPLLAAVHVFGKGILFLSNDGLRNISDRLGRKEYYEHALSTIAECNPSLVLAFQRLGRLMRQVDSGLPVQLPTFNLVPGPEPIPQRIQDAIPLQPLHIAPQKAIEDK